MPERVLDRLRWLGHDCFLYEGPPVVYFDPYEVHVVEPADIILVSHEHFDHCSPADIQKVWRGREGTAIVTDQSAARKLGEPLIALNPGEQTTVGETLIEAVPAYNLNKSFHPQRAGHLGFIVTLEGLRVYHAGDTDFIPEMRDFEVDIALLPVSGTYVMDAGEAAQAALALGPRVAIPMHYGAIVGSHEDAEKFRSLLAGKIRVEILTKG